MKSTMTVLALSFSFLSFAETIETSVVCWERHETGFLHIRGYSYVDSTSYYSGSLVAREDQVHLDECQKSQNVVTCKSSAKPNYLVKLILAKGGKFTGVVTYPDTSMEVIPCQAEVEVEE